jgi:hypothetical protein
MASPIVVPPPPTSPSAATAPPSKDRATTMRFFNGPGLLVIDELGTGSTPGKAHRHGVAQSVVAAGSSRAVRADRA